MVKNALINLMFVLMLTLTNIASSDPNLDQWLDTEKTYKDLINEGYEVKSYSISDIQTSNGLMLLLFVTVLQKDNDIFIKEDQDGTERLVNDNLFQRRIMGLVSYYESKATGFPDLQVNDMVNVNMSDYQFADYNFVREIEKKTEKGGKKKE